MKKNLIFAMAAVALATISYARSADRGSMSGITAEDIRAQQPAQASVAAPAPAAEPAPAAKTATVSVVVAAPAKAPAPAAEQAPAPVAVACEQCASTSDFTTEFGRNWAAIGGGASYRYNSDAEILGATGVLEVSVNVFKDESDTYGLNLLLPLAYDYMSISSETDSHSFEFPLSARPYFRVYKGENVVITAYGEMLAGGAYRYISAETFATKSLAFVWGGGCGVEVSLFKDFSITPRYRYVSSEDGESLYYQYAGCSFAWKFAEKLTAVLDYGHYFYKSVDGDLGVVKLRYEF